MNIYLWKCKGCRRNALILGLITMFVGMILTSSASARNWTDNTGKYSIDAELIKVEGQIVHLRRSHDKKTLKVPLERLSHTDRKFIGSPQHNEAQNGRSLRHGPADALGPSSTKIPEKAKRLNDQAKQYHLSGQSEKAIKLLTEVIKLAPTYADAYNNMAAAYTAHPGKGSGAKAISFSKQAIEMNPNTAIYHGTLGLAYYRMKDFDHAVETFEQSVALKENDHRALHYSLLGNCFLRKEMPDEAITAYKKALQLNPSLTGARRNLRVAESTK